MTAQKTGAAELKAGGRLIGRMALVLCTVVAAMVLASGVALAATSAIHCPNDPSQGLPSDFLYCYGTSAADTMYGSDLKDNMFGKGGNDTMHGYGSNDLLEGDNGSDHLYGDSGNDSLLWGGAYDEATNTYPDKSDDYVHGGSGNDYIIGGYAQSGVDRLFGEGGNDYIEASQREDPSALFQVTKEIIDCGAGASDVVYFDKGLDVVATNCEIKHPY